MTESSSSYEQFSDNQIDEQLSNLDEDIQNVEEEMNNLDELNNELNSTLTQVEKKLKNSIIKIDIQKKMYNKIMKYINILFSYSDMISNYNQIFVYGELLENLIRKKNIKNKTLCIFFQNLQENYLLHFIDNLYNSAEIVNENYKSSNRIPTMYGYMSFFQLKIKLDTNYHIYMNLHNECFKDFPLFNTNNITLTKDGLTIREFTNFELKKNYKYKSLGLLDNLIDNIYNKTHMNYFSNQLCIDELFDHLDKQNELIKKGFNIEQGYKIDKNPESFCGVCRLKHLEDDNTFLYELECSHSFCSVCLEKLMNTDLNHCYDCPLCRQEITIKTKK
jgi:hypothetical protein